MDLCRRWDAGYSSSSQWGDGRSKRNLCLSVSIAIGTSTCRNRKDPFSVSQQQEGSCHFLPSATSSIYGVQSHPTPFSYYEPTFVPCCCDTPLAMLGFIYNNSKTRCPPCTELQNKTILSTEYVTNRLESAATIVFIDSLLLLSHCCFHNHTLRHCLRCSSPRRSFHLVSYNKYNVDPWCYVTTTYTTATILHYDCQRCRNHHNNSHFHDHHHQQRHHEIQPPTYHHQHNVNDDDDKDNKQNVRKEGTTTASTTG